FFARKDSQSGFELRMSRLIVPLNGVMDSPCTTASAWTAGLLQCAREQAADTGTAGLSDKRGEDGHRLRHQFRLEPELRECGRGGRQPTRGPGELRQRPG